MTVETDRDWNLEDFSEEMRDAIKDALHRIGRVNIAVFGRTGAGKSTLINAVFGENRAKTGIGRPITKGMHYYEHPNGIMGLYDSEGFELGDSGRALIDKLRDIVRDSRSKPISEQIHVVWYCLRADDRRFEDGQSAFVRALAELRLPVMMVFTQVEYGIGDTPKQDVLTLAEYVQSLKLPLAPRNFVHLTNAAEEADSRNPTPVHGVQELLDATFQVVPEAVSEALTAAQHVDKSRKTELCRDIIKQATAAAGVAAVVPIPLADSALIMPIQVHMMARIATVWDLPVDGMTLTGLAARAFFSQGVAQLAKSVVRGLLSWIPGLNAAVTVMKAGVASTLTWAVGEAWLAVCIALSDESSDGIRNLVDSPEISRLFIETFKQNAKS